MKKILFSLPLFAFLLTACEPSTDNEGASAVTNAQMEQIVTITQNPANSNCVTMTSPGYVIVTDETGSLVYRGPGGYFEVTPGGAENQTWTIVKHNWDGTTAQTTKQITISEYLNVAPEWELFTNMDTKEWTWDTESFPGQWFAGAVWGNAGYQAGDGSTFVNDGNGIWWGAKPDELSGQLNHSDTGEAIGEEDANAYMKWKLAGKQIKCYDKDGKEIRTGSFSFTTATADSWKVGTLTTSAGAILFPFKINGGGTKPTSFDIMQLSADKMKLIYADPGTGGWGESTWWAFKAK